MIEQRWYLDQAIANIYSYFQTEKGNPVIAWPTGTGKSFLPAVFIQQVMGMWPTQRFMLLTHVKELVEQNAKRVREIWPLAPIGIYSAGLKSRDTQQPIIFGGVASVNKCVPMFGHIDILFIDECHLLSPDEDTMYMGIIAQLRAINPYLKVIGLSATPFRLGQGLITDGGLFTHVIHDLTGYEMFNRLIAEGYLCPLIPRPTKTTLDISKVGLNGGELAQKALQKAVDKEEITFAALQEACQYGHDRRSWLLFASGIDHAEHCANMLAMWGIPSAAVHSKMAIEERNARIESFKRGELRCLTNNNVLTTGFDFPPIDLILMLRPTLSPGLWVQMAGRGTRPSRETGKGNCIAEGSLVLTDVGLIPIEKITVKMKIWDGVEFVKHNGIICKGRKNVIEYAGLVATPEHLVFTQEGWQEIGKCALANTPVAVTANGKFPLQKSYGYFRTGTSEASESKSLYASSLRRLFKNFFTRIYQLEVRQSRLSLLWQSSQCTEMALQSLQCSETTMFKSERRSLFRLRRQGNNVSFYKLFGNGSLSYEFAELFKRITIRPHRQQRTLSSWQSLLVNGNRKYEKQKIGKKLVFDIINAGPRFRFTVNGLLVHNCLLLDFAGNTKRLGPINDPRIPRKKGEGGGDPPVKICDACGVYNHARAVHCINCGAEFAFKIKITQTAATEQLLKSDIPVIDYFNVQRVIYEKHVGKNAQLNKNTGQKTAILKVSYHCGLNMFKSWICLEHEGYAGKVARNWWRQCHVIEPPSTIDEALKYIDQLRVPKRIRVWLNKEPQEVLTFEY